METARRGASGWQRASAHARRPNAAASSVTKTVGRGPSLSLGRGWLGWVAAACQPAPGLRSKRLPAPLRALQKNMLFNSYGFLFVFLPLTLAGFFWLGRHSGLLAAGWLTLASLTFYGWWDWRFVPLLVLSIAFNYMMGLVIARTHGQSRQRWFVIAVAADLMLLGYFKYANLLVSSLNDIARTTYPALDIVLPLGISFFTFTQIAYLADVFQDKAREARLVHYALFVSYFPHLIAGPILHHKEMMPQFAERRTYRLQRNSVLLGAVIFTLGLAKKVLIADNLAPFANAAFGSPDHPSLLLAWGGVLAYSFQIYFDFSGYSDMAIGLSRLFGIRLPLNFNSPYKSRNIIEFWRRWHMTLSRFLRDYLYFPLGGNRHGPARRYANLMITMLLGGLWHGAGWNFAIWGALHGLFLSVNHLWNTQELMHRFRPALATSGERLDAKQLRLRLNWKWATAAGLLAGASLLSLSRPTEFLYFQF